MNDAASDAGVIAVVLERLRKQRLPRALAIKEKVDGGETLDEFDLQFLKDVLADAHTLGPLIERHPEHRELAERMIDLYNHITERALKNEKSS